MDADTKTESKAHAEPQSRLPEAPQGSANSQKGLQLKYDEDFASLYANNVRFESSVWDLKLLFGQLDQSTGGEVIELHTSMTIPWPTAKLMLYYLNVNIALHEIENGKISVNPRVFPTIPAPFPPELESNELAKAAHEIASKMRAEFVSNQQSQEKA